MAGVDIVIFFGYIFQKEYMMKTEIEVKLQEYNQNETTTKTYHVATDGYDVDEVIERITKFVKRNYDQECSISLRVESINDPSMVTPLTSSLGRSLSRYVPFNIELDENIPAPKDYDAIWV